MKKYVLFLGVISIIFAFFSSCKPEDSEKPTITVNFVDNISEGWYGDTIKFGIAVDCIADYTVAISNNHDAQAFNQNYKAGPNVVDFNYVIPTDLVDGNIVKVTFTATNTGAELSEIVEKEITINLPSAETIYHHGTISENEIWLAKDIHIVDDDVIVRALNNPILTIEKGATVFMQTGTSITIGGSANYGTLIAKGDIDNIITFTSHATVPQAGDWDWIQFSEGATNCLLEYCDIKYGAGNSSWGMVDVINNALVSVKNCTLTNFENYGVEAEDDNGFVEFTNNTLTKATGHAMKILGRHVKTIGSGNIFNVDANSGILVTGSSSSYNYIESDALWLKQNCPYFIEDDIVVKNNATLTIEAGSVLKFMADVSLEVGTSTEFGKIIAQGTSTDKIVFTSASPSPQKGDWKYIDFKNNTITGSILDYCEIAYAGRTSINADYGNIHVSPCGTGNPIISNCEIHHSNNFGIFINKDSGVYGDPAMSNINYHDNNQGDIGME